MLVLAPWQLYPRDAAADPPRYELHWTAPTACPDADTVRARVDALLVGAPPRESPPLRATVDVEAIAQGWRLRLATSQASGARVLEGPDCGELAATAALIVAIAVDPRVLTRIDDPVAPPVPEPPAPAVVASVPTPSPTPTVASPSAPPERTKVAVNRAAEATPTPPSSSRRVRAPVALALAQLGLDVGSLPGPSAHVGASMGLLWPRGRAVVEGDYVARRRLRSASNPDITVLAQAWSVGLRGCVVAWQRRRLSLPVCGSARGGLLHGRGGGALLPREARQPWLGVGPGVLLVAALRPRIALVFGLDALVAALRGGFRTNREDRFAQPWPLALQASAGVQLSGLTRVAGGGQPRR
ncbi:MAG: hypothetical protein IPH07_05030 [Deltaproteobacteria bacterium]|nr:hypothetical protein [Deltaproteobacteria bacterium]MBP7287556.1 hypothetical protein [Nannocystaceae bacterium]